MFSPASRALMTPSVFLVVAACSAQAGTTYRGEPLATLSGTVQSDSNSPPGGAMDAALVWAQVNFSPNAQQIQSVNSVGEAAPVVGQFPASFTLNVYQPPPPSVLIACPSSSAHIAVAFIVAVPAGANLSSGNSVEAVTGEAVNWMLLYLDSDEPAGWSCLPDLGFAFAPTKGFHLMAQEPMSLKLRAEGACYPAYAEAPAGLETPISITLYGGTFPWNISLSSSACSCVSTCEEKATTCGASSPQAMSDAVTECEQFCGGQTSPAATPSQVSCLQSSDCTSLKDACMMTGTVCGVPCASVGGSASVVDAGPNPPRGDAAGP